MSRSHTQILCWEWGRVFCRLAGDQWQRASASKICKILCKINDSLDIYIFLHLLSVPTGIFFIAFAFQERFFEVEAFIKNIFPRRRKNWNNKEDRNMFLCYGAIFCLAVSWPRKTSEMACRVTIFHSIWAPSRGVYFYSAQFLSKGREKIR